MLADGDHLAGIDSEGIYDVLAVLLLVASQQKAADRDGRQPGTPAYIQCRTQLDTARTQAAAMIAASPTSCTSNRAFGTTYTNCY